jgi:hypothetical protein
MAAKGRDKKIYYQYGTLNTETDYVPYFTNIVLTSEAVVLVRNGHTKSVCIKDPEICREYRLMFEAASSVSKELVVFAHALEDMFHYLSELSFNNVRQRIIFEMCPCLFQNVTEQLLRDKIVEGIPERELLIRDVMAYASYNGSVIQSGKIPMIHCFDGYRDFMESGLLRDIPSRMYIPLTMKERIEMLERYINSIGDSDLYVLKKPIGSVEHGLYVFLYDHSLMFQFQDQDGVLVVMMLSEFSFFEAFDDYLESLRKKPELFYTKEELKTKLTVLLSEYKQRYIQSAQQDA